MTTIVSIAPPPRPPCSSGSEAASRPELRELGPMLRVAPRLAARELAPILVFVIVGEIALDRIAQQRLFFREGEIHLVVPEGGVQQKYPPEGTLEASAGNRRHARLGRAWRLSARQLDWGWRRADDDTET